MEKQRVVSNMIAFALPMLVISAAGISISKRVWVQAALMGFAGGLLVGAFLITRLKR